MVQSSQPVDLRRNTRVYIRRQTSKIAIQTVIHSSAIRLGARLSSGGKGADIVQEDSKVDGGEERRG